jgi:hypothetical protein
MAGHTPTSAQNSKLATLQATLVSAQASYNANVAALATAATALKAAQENVKNYEAYIYGGTQLPNVVDGGSRDNA